MKKIILLIMSLACVCAMFSSCSSEKESKIVTEDGKLIVKTYSSTETAGTKHGLQKECDLTLTVGKEEKTNVGVSMSLLGSGRGVMIKCEYDGADLYFDVDGGSIEQSIQIKAFKFEIRDLTPETSVSSPCDILWWRYGYVDEEGTKTSIAVNDAVIKIIAKQGSDIVGAALLKIHYEPSDLYDMSIIPFTNMTLEKSVSFPKVKGKAQNITEEYLNEFFAAA